jgi:hypothetical protein
MATSLVDAQSVLAVDIGSVNTRAHLFDVVDGQYHFIASGVVPSTLHSPYFDSREGVHQALQRLEEITGRTLLDSNTFIVLPSRADGAGVDQLVITISAGPDLKIVTAGLLTDVSLESAQRLASAAYGQVVDSIGLNDRRRPDLQIDAILRSKPDLMIVAGGTDRGATRSVMKNVDLAVMICKLLPQNQRPEVLFAGNQVLAKKVKESLEKLTSVHTAPNIRPTIDSEDLQPALDTLARVSGRVRMRQVGGFESLASLASTTPVQTSHAFGRVIRFLSKIYNTRGVLGVDIGANATTLAAAASGKLALNVMRPLGMGAGAVQVLQQGRLEDVTQWLPMHVSEETVRDAIWQKSLFPASLPLTGETLAIDQAVARQILRLAAGQMAARWPGFSSGFEPIIASGAIFSQATSAGQSLLMLLDGLQPVGITTFYLDQNQVTAGLGAASELNSLLPVQVIETGAYQNLGTVICPVSSTRYGTSILNVALDYGDGNITQTEIKQGTLTALQLNPGQTAQIEFKPLRSRVEIDPRRKDGPQRFKVTGGMCGVVIDARGRPLVLPPDAPRRREMIKKWSLVLS